MNTENNLTYIYEQMLKQSIDLSKFKGPSKEQKQQSRFNALRRQIANYTTGDIIIDDLPEDTTDLTGLNIPKIVRGSFVCSGTEITSLQGGPEEVQGDFNCSFNKLTDLQGAPRKVKGSFNCSNNKLISLQGGPEQVHGDFNCKYNLQLNDYTDAPKRLGGMFYSDRYRGEIPKHIK